MKFIVVFFFESLSVDQEYIYFVDGMLEEIIFVFSWVEGFKVIVRMFSFVYCDWKIDVWIIGN